jgi:hypothetical protein
MRKLVFTAATVLFASAATSHAQSAKYCNNALVANSFYSNVHSNGKTAEVEYHGQFQNQDTSRRAMIATMVSMTRIGAFNVLRPIARFDLNAYEQKDIKLLYVQTQGPAGQGAPTPAQVGGQIRFVCTFK